MKRYKLRMFIGLFLVNKGLQGFSSLVLLLLKSTGYRHVLTQKTSQIELNIEQ